MGLFKKIAEAREMAAEQESQESKAPKQKKERRGLLDTIGVKRDKEKSDQDLERESRHATIQQIWAYLRNEIDLGVQEYTTSGESQKLKTWLGPEIYSRMIAHLQELNSAGLTWSYPGRSVQSRSRVRVIDEKLNITTKHPTQFTLAERFLDYSEYQGPNGTESADGSHQEIEATVDVLTENNAPVYRIVSLKRISGD